MRRRNNLKELLLRSLLVAGSSAMASVAMAQDHTARTALPTAEPARVAPHPGLSEDPFWAVSMVIIVAGLFVAAAVIGPVVRANAPDEPPVTPHDPAEHDAHASSHSHGH